MVTPDFSNFPVLQTPRLVLRKLEKDDAPGVFRLRSDAAVMKYIPRPLAVNINDAIIHIEMIQDLVAKNEVINWVICEKDDLSTFLGIIGIYRMDIKNWRAEVGYMLHSQYHGKGFISESLKAVLTYAFQELQFHSIQALIDPENVASENVLKKCGFSKEAHLREYEYYDGRFWDTVIYSILSSAYDDQYQF
ncbi:MAG: GNAT family N-acetyltransferase [Saprospiraceae bacterium]|jgi:ribosomal-protein-alanine N-acetyltransferase|nr:GNAT family N-acetyltransferase [Saprospiraceae bacterium]